MSTRDTLLRTVIDNTGANMAYCLVCGVIICGQPSTCLEMAQQLAL